MYKEKFFEELWWEVNRNFEIVDEYEDFEDVEDCYFDIVVKKLESRGKMNYRGVEIEYFVDATCNDGRYKRITSASLDVLGDNEEFDKWLDQFNAVEELDNISYNKQNKTNYGLQ
jgi:hypothetical protein